MTPACVSRTAWPAIVSVAVRGDVVGFAVTDTETVQLPEPDAVLMVAQGTGLWVVHGHPDPVLMETFVSALPPGTATEVCVTE